MLGDFSPCSDTMLSGEKSHVAVLSCCKLNSVKLGTVCRSLLPPLSAPQNYKKKNSTFYSKLQKCHQTQRERKKVKSFTEIGGFKDGRLVEMAVEPANGKLGTTAPHLIKNRTVDKRSEAFQMIRRYGIASVQLQL